MQEFSPTSIPSNTKFYSVSPSGSSLHEDLPIDQRLGSRIQSRPRCIFKRQPRNISQNDTTNTTALRVSLPCAAKLAMTAKTQTMIEIQITYLLFTAQLYQPSRQNNASL